MKPALHVVGDRNSTENKAAIPPVHVFLFVETATVAAVFCLEYDASRTHSANNQQDQAYQGRLRPLKDPQQWPTSY